ncbi:MAG: pitrilysin family protein [Bacteroidia bacterium]
MIKEAPYNIHTFSNGIRLIHQRTGLSDIAHCAVLINAGTRDEEQGKEGLAHFIEHVLFKGTTHRKSIHILNRLEVVGGELNAYTTKEETCVHASFMIQHFERAMELICDIIFNSIFPVKELEKEKDVILDEIRSYLDSPAEQIFDDFESQVFSNHTLGNPVLGTFETVKNFSRKDIFNFIDKNYFTDKMVVSVVGDFDFEKVVAMCEKYIGKIKAKRKAMPRKPFKNYKPKIKTVTKQTEQAHFILGCKAYSFKDHKRIKLILLNNILGGPGMNSRLNLSIREKYGYTYNIESNYIAYSDAGIFSLYLATEKKLLDKTIALAKKELDRLCDEPIKEKQLLQYKQQLIGQIALSQENKASVMIGLGRSLMNHGKVDTLQQVYEKIEHITAEQLQHAAQEIFDEKQQSSLLFTN